MAEQGSIGKFSPKIFNELILPRLGVKDDSVLAGPGPGADAGMVEIGGQAVAITAGPVFIVPECGWERAAWFAFHLLASDAVTSGLTPRYLAIDLNLPVDITDEQLKMVWNTMHRESQKLGIAIVAEHTARYENCRYPMVGGATMVSVGPLEKYVGPGFIQPGDKLIITKGPAIEATGIFATTFYSYIEQVLGKESARKTSEIFYKMSVVTEALAAVSAGVRDDGVSAMHDATEGGIWGGVFDMAEAAGLGVRVDQDRIVIEPGVLDVCRLYGIDPYTSISEGTLLIACRPDRAEEVVRLIKGQGIKASIAGEFTEKEQGKVLIRGGNPRPLARPAADPFWQAFYTHLARAKKVAA
jgi:hydrogenase maturation factor